MADTCRLISILDWVGDGHVIHKLQELNTMVLGGAVVCVDCEEQPVENYSC